jgi:tetratricopeptide (TPR) repeat protein
LTLLTGTGVSTYLAILANDRAWDAKMEVILATIHVRRLHHQMQRTMTPRAKAELVNYTAEYFDQSARALREKLKANPTDVLSELILLPTLMDIAEIRLEQDRHAEAEAAVRECLSYEDPTDTVNRDRLWRARFVLGCSLVGQQRFEEAEPHLAEGWKGMRQNEILFDAQYLAMAAHRVCQVYNKWERSRESRTWQAAHDQVRSQLLIELPDDVRYFNALGYTHHFNAEWTESIEAYRKALEIVPNDIAAHDNLFQVTRLADLDASLPAITQGEQTPGSSGEWIEFAKLCAFKRHYRQSVDFYTKAFAMEDETAEELKDAHRYHAACAAALAASGQGVNPPRTETERANLRKLARQWLKEDVERWVRDRNSQIISPGDSLLGATFTAEMANRANRDTHAEVAQEMELWIHDKNLATIRDKDELAKFPTDERQAFDQLWSQVQSLVTSGSP